ncbi:MAG: response regulator [Planctomycetota bacterium]
MVESRQIEVLLVDNSSGDGESLRAAFDQTGLSNVVYVVPDSDAALECLRSEQTESGERVDPSLILLDMNSQTGGQPAVTEELALLGELKGDPALRSVPVIVVTESSAEADILNAYSSGACSFVSKPDCPVRRRLLYSQLAEYWAHVAQLPRTGSNLDDSLTALLKTGVESEQIASLPVLVVDDSEDDVLLLKEAFVDCPLVDFVGSVEDGESALRYLRGQAPYVDSRRPAIVLLDINMPRMNGFEVLAEMRADDALAGMPVVMLTSSKQESDILRAYSNGACSFISKPVNFDRMRQIAQRFSFYWTLVANTPPLDTLVVN